MPVELQVIRASEFVCLDADELLDFDESKAALRTLAQACRKRGLARALMDLRTLPVPPKRLFTPTQLASLVGTFRDAGFSRQHRLAILYDHDVYGGVRNFAFISRMKGMDVQTFTSFESAMQWLSEADEEPEECQQGEEIVPVINRQSKERKRPAAWDKQAPPGRRTSK